MTRRLIDFLFVSTCQFSDVFVNGHIRPLAPTLAILGLLTCQPTVGWWPIRVRAPYGAFAPTVAICLRIAIGTYTYQMSLIIGSAARIWIRRAGAGESFLRLRVLLSHMKSRT